MNPSKLYVPNPQKWVEFFEKVAKGKVQLGQTGKGSISQIIPMDIYTPQSTSDKSKESVTLVSPAEQTVDQAKSELERDNIKPSKVKELFQKEHLHRTERYTKRKSTSRKGGKVPPKKKRKTQFGSGGRKNQIPPVPKDIFQF